MTDIVLLEMHDLRLVHSVLVDLFRDDPEPMPEWSEADRALLETLCGCTEVRAFGRSKYPELHEKAAKLFYSGVKLHASPNGNKRFGVVVAMVFLLKNGHALKVRPGELVDLATRVANADPHQRETKPDRVIKLLGEAFEGLLVSAPTGSEQEP